LRDVLTTLAAVCRIQVILYPTQVQGEGAGAKIAQAIATAAAREECDVLLSAGGGSIEDLWAFNEEIVARTIANCPMPVIAGIGHETDLRLPISPPICAQQHRRQRQNSLPRRVSRLHN
jgi:exodeoxyribonuclease VII large subunit